MDPRLRVALHRRARRAAGDILKRRACMRRARRSRYMYAAACVHSGYPMDLFFIRNDFEFGTARPESATPEVRPQIGDFRTNV
jgi:hypothetical protein